MDNSGNKNEIILGDDLPKFEGKAEQRHEIKTPGDAAHQVLIAEEDDKTWLVSTGVYDCAILTVCTTDHKGGKIRAMAHYNKLSGPRGNDDVGLKKMFEVVQKASSGSSKWTTTIAYKGGRPTDYAKSLAEEVEKAKPGLAIVKRKYDSDQERISVFLAPDGTVSALGDGKIKRTDGPRMVIGGRGNRENSTA